MNGRTDRQKNRWMDGWANGGMDGRMDGQTPIRLHFATEEKLTYLKRDLAT